MTRKLNLLLAFLIPNIIAAQNSVMAEKPAETEQGVLKGRITNKANKGVYRAYIQLQDCRDLGIHSPESCEVTFGQALSDANGNYSLPYVIEASKKVNFHSLYATHDDYTPIVRPYVRIGDAAEFDLVLPPKIYAQANGVSQVALRSLSRAELTGAFLAAKVKGDDELTFWTSTRLAQTARTNNERHFYADEATIASLRRATSKVPANAGDNYGFSLATQAVAAETWPHEWTRPSLAMAAK